MRPSLSESYMWNRTGAAVEGSVREWGARALPPYFSQPYLTLSKRPQQ